MPPALLSMALLPSVGPPVVLRPNDTVVYVFDENGALDVAAILRPQLIGIVLSSVLLGVFGMMLGTWCSHSSAAASRVERSFVALLLVGVGGGWLAQLFKAGQVFVADFGELTACLGGSDGKATRTHSSSMSLWDCRTTINWRSSSCASGRYA